jgi:hypothetical protein
MRFSHIFWRLGDFAHETGETEVKTAIICAAIIAATVSTASAEITCSMHGGCWETGGKIRLPDSPYRGVTTSIVSRDGNGRVDTRNFRYIDSPGVPNRAATTNRRAK